MTPTDIAGMIRHTFVPRAKDNLLVLTELGKVAEQILEAMQQNTGSGYLTPYQLARFRQLSGGTFEKKGAAFLSCVNDADERVKASFAFGLFAVAAHLLKDVSLDFYDRVSRSTAMEYIKIGGARIQKKSFRQALKHVLTSCAKSGQNEIALVIVGKLGVGKSTLINALLGEKRAETSAGMDHCTTSPKTYPIPLPDDNLPINLVVWDTPGLETAQPNAEDIYKTLKKIAEVGKVDLFIFCVDSSNPRQEKEGSLLINTINKAFTRGIWKHSLFVLTKGNMLRASGDETTDDAMHFENTVEKLVEGYQELLISDGLESAAVNQIPFVPVGNSRDKVLPNGKAWLPEFWVTAFERATSEGSGFLLLVNENRLKLCTGKGKENEEYQRNDDVILSQTLADRVALTASKKMAVRKACSAPDYRYSFSDPTLVGAAIGASLGFATFGPVGATIGSVVVVSVGVLISTVLQAVKFSFK